jgi:type VI protein secretion system component Hcp
MENTKYDIAMKFVLPGDGTVWAESTMQVDPKDSLMKGFDPITDFDDYSNFFEVQSFDFALTVDPHDAGGGQGAGRGGRTGANIASAGYGRAPASAPRTHGGPAAAKPDDGPSDPFTRWRSATQQQAQKMKFDLHFESFRFKRVIDAASPLFFEYCAHQKRFDSAVLVKRVSTGNVGGSGLSQAFLRFEFTGVLLRSIKWDDGDLVTESVEFVCNGMTFQYKQQSASGALSAAKEPAIWDRSKDSERKEEDENG